jgi:hypothetical protein
MSTKVTLEVDGITTSLSIDKDELTFTDFMEHLVEPAIIATGYSKSLLEEWKEIHHGH